MHEKDAKQERAGGGEGDAEPSKNGINQKSEQVKSDEPIQARVVDLVFQALPAIGSAVGFVGFVAVLGGAIDWVRFSAADLPSDQAVAAIPQSDLVAVGAVSLIGFVVLGAIAVVGVYLIDENGNPTEGMRRGIVVLMTVELAVAVVYADFRWWGYLLVGAWLVLLVAATIPFIDRVAAVVNKRTTASQELSGVRRALNDDLDSMLSRIPVAIVVTAAVVVALLLFDEPWWFALLTLAIVPAIRTPSRFPALPVVLAAGLVVVLHYDESKWLAIMVVVVAVLGAANIGIAKASKRFVWYGIAVFASVAIFGSVLAAARTIRSPKVQPAAVLREGGQEGVCGIYVTETDDRVYLGRVELNKPESDDALPASGRIFWISLDDVESVAVGPLQGIDSANRRAPKMLQELFNDSKKDREQPSKTTTKVSKSTKAGGANAGSDETSTVEEKTTVGSEKQPDAGANKPAVALKKCTKETLRLSD